MKEYGTFRVDGTTWRVVGAGIPEPGEYFTGNTRPDVFKAAQGIYERIPRVIVERVEEEKPPCEHINASAPDRVNDRWYCRDCGKQFWAYVFVARDTNGIKRHWRHIAQRTPGRKELYVTKYPGFEEVCRCLGTEPLSAMYTIVVSADEAS